MNPFGVSVIAHGSMAGLPGHDELMLLMPIMPLLLILTILVVTFFARRGYLGDTTQELDVSKTWAVVAAALSLGAAAIHFAVIQEHVEEDQLEGVFFFVSGWAQLIWAMAYVLRPSDALRMIGAAGNAAIVALWLVSRTVGLPFGATPWQAEALGMPDLFATAFEIALAALLCFALVPRLQRHVSGHSLPLEKAYVFSGFGMLTVALFTGLALLSPAAA